MVLRQLFSVLVLFFVLSAMTFSVLAAPVLNVKPHICIKKKSENACSLNLAIHLELDTPLPVCFHAREAQHEQCFPTQTTFQYSADFSVESSFMLKVSERDTHAFIAEQIIRVLRYDPDTTKVRRRFGWGF